MLIKMGPKALERVTNCSTGLLAAWDPSTVAGMRRYRRRSDSMARLLKYFSDYQRRNAVAPTSTREIGAELGISHMQVARLRRRAIEDGLLVFDSEGRVAVRRVANATEGYWCYSVPLLRRGPDGRLEKLDPLRRVVLDRHLFQAGRPSGLLAIVGPLLRQAPNRLRVTATSTLIVREAKDRTRLARDRWHMLETAQGPVLLQVRYRAGAITERSNLSGAKPVELAPKHVLRAFEVRYVLNDPHPNAG
jgi:hypothetical protein